MALGSDVIPVWMILMPYDQWKAGEISDQQLMEWLDDPDNCVPINVKENWRAFFAAKEEEKGDSS